MEELKKYLSPTFEIIVLPAEDILCFSLLDDEDEDDYEAETLPFGG